MLASLLPANIAILGQSTSYLWLLLALFANLRALVLYGQLLDSR